MKGHPCDGEFRRRILWDEGVLRLSEAMGIVFLSGQAGLSGLIMSRTRNGRIRYCYEVWKVLFSIPENHHTLLDKDLKRESIFAINSTSRGRVWASRDGKKSNRLYAEHIGIVKLGLRLPLQPSEQTFVVQDLRSDRVYARY